MKRISIFLLLIIILGGLGLAKCSSFGGDVTGDRLVRAQASPHYQDDGFVNTIPQSPFSWSESWSYLQAQFFYDEVRVPPSTLPIISKPLDLLATPPESGLRAIWLGHASVYVELDGVRLLLDPVFSERVSPFSFFGPSRSHPPPIALSELPKIDAVLISHDHYDHLDMATIKHLAANGSQFFVPLGVGAHLDEWQVNAEQITELDWWQSAEIAGLNIVSTPNRHYSGREAFDFKKTFWSSWSIIGPEHRLYYSGDTGFSDHFLEIGDKLGPFDLSIIKIGAYGPGDNWLDIHMEPERAVQAHVDVQARRMLPVHWATFNLALHDWNEPIKRAVKAAEELHVDLVTPRVGEVISSDVAFESTDWWNEV